MSSVEFAQHALRERVAPPSLGSVKARLRHAGMMLARRKWSANRIKDVWYADPRICPNADEIRDLEEITGLKYGRKELTAVDALISQADALLGSPDENFPSPLVVALRALISALDSARAGRD